MYYLLIILLIFTAQTQNLSTIYKDSTKNILLIFAHPDDELVYAGGLLTSVATKAKVHELLMTNGNNGTCFKKDGFFFNQSACPCLPDNKCLELGSHRLQELQCVIDSTNLTYEFFDMRANRNLFGHDTVVNYLINKIDSIRPDIIITHDSCGGYGNQDHIDVSRYVLYSLKHSTYKPSRFLYSLESLIPKGSCLNLETHDTIMINWQSFINLSYCHATQNVPSDVWEVKPVDRLNRFHRYQQN